MSGQQSAPRHTVCAGPLLFNSYDVALLPSDGLGLDSFDLSAWPSCQMISYLWRPNGPANVGCILLLPHSPTIPAEMLGPLVASIKAGMDVVIHAPDDETATAAAATVLEITSRPALIPADGHSLDTFELRAWPKRQTTCARPLLFDGIGGPLIPADGLWLNAFDLRAWPSCFMVYGDIDDMDRPPGASRIVLLPPDDPRLSNEILAQLIAAVEAGHDVFLHAPNNITAIEAEAGLMRMRRGGGHA